MKQESAPSFLTNKLYIDKTNQIVNQKSVIFFNASLLS